MSDPAHITDLVDRARTGDARAVDELLPLVYEELRRLAEHRLGGEDRGHTLQATALVHEVYIRLAGQDRAQWKGRAHLMAIAAETLRRVLIDHARARKGLKRGGGRRPISLDTSLIAPDHPETGLLDLHEALERLAETRTVERHWQFARAWLARELGGR